MRNNSRSRREQRYESAVQRNLAGFRPMGHYEPTPEAIKKIIGIRQDDDHFNDQVGTFVNQIESAQNELKESSKFKKRRRRYK